MFESNDDTEPPVLVSGCFLMIAQEFGGVQTKGIAACCVDDDGYQMQIAFADIDDLLAFVRHHKPSEIHAPQGSRLQRMIDDALSGGTASRTLH